MKRYWKQVSHKDTTLCIVGLQLRLGACEGVDALILLSTDRGFVKNNDGSRKGI